MTTATLPTPPTVSPSVSPKIRYKRSTSSNSLRSNVSSSSGKKAATQHEKGVPHIDVVLEAKKYKTPEFHAQVLRAVRDDLRVTGWNTLPSNPDPELKVFKVSGSLTNAVFFVSSPTTVPPPPTLLLRVYGPSSGTLISRERELHTLHVLSSRYGIGPRVLGTMQNARVEQFFHSAALTARDMRDPTTSAYVAARMRELHSVDPRRAAPEFFTHLVSSHTTTTTTKVDDGLYFALSEPFAARATVRNMREWLVPARDVLALLDAMRPPGEESPAPGLTKQDFERFVREWEAYARWLEDGDTSPLVFAHNDTQYGNLLRLNKPLDKGIPPHHSIIVVDFEYAAPNAAAFDIANHFQEWTANYHDDSPHTLDPARFPSADERRNFYVAYLGLGTPAPEEAAEGWQTELDAAGEKQVWELEDQVMRWCPASHAMWAVWGIVQARNDVVERVQEPEFDYLGYASGRIEAFRREIRERGIVLDQE